MDDRRSARARLTAEEVWRKREFALRTAELQHSKSQRFLPYLTMIVSVAAIFTSGWVGNNAADSAAASAYQSAQSAASSAQQSAQISADTAIRTSQKSAEAVIASAETSARAARASAERSSAAARESIERKWQQELLDDQRKALQADIRNFVSILTKGIDLVFGATAENQIPGHEFDKEAAARWEREYRLQIIAQNEASLGLHMDSSELSAKFVKLHIEWANIGDTVSEILVSGRHAPKEEWLNLHQRLLRINVLPLVDNALPLIKRPLVKSKD